uniref:PRA1 family protein n=1 Tax=Oreochromis aureus TaxID=47969 RepID=A0A668S5I5_OREAU
MALVTAVFLVVGILNPPGTFVAIAVVSALSMVSVWVEENGAAINFKKQKPSAFIILIMTASCILISTLGSIMVFMWATLPLILPLIYPDASCRLCNMKNKLESKIDRFGPKYDWI